MKSVPAMSALRLTRLAIILLITHGTSGLAEAAPFDVSFSGTHSGISHSALGGFTPGTWSVVGQLDSSVLGAGGVGYQNWPLTGASFTINGITSPFGGGTYGQGSLPFVLVGQGPGVDGPGSYFPPAAYTAGGD